MSEVVVGRLRIACRAGAARRSEALALRRRLERVSRTELPRALERRARGWRDATIGPVAVAFDFDPRAYDDVTLAVLWADRIGRAVERAAREAGDGRTLPARRGPEIAWPAVAAAAAGAGGRAGGWTALLARALTGDAGALAELGDALEAPADRSAVLAALAPGQAAALAARLEALATRGQAAPGVDRAAADPPPPAGEARGGPLRAGEDGPAGRAWPGAEHPLEPGASRALRAAAARLREGGAGRRAGAARGRGAEPARDRAAGPPVLATGCAGIVLLYPWLPRRLAEAAEAQPEVHPVAVRRLALAAIVAEPGAEDDPLVRLLAGDDPTAPLGPPLPPAPEADAVAAEALLRRFAGALPGFERSTPGYLRRELIVRPGAVELDREPIRVVLAAAPLDVMLRMLPYPLGVFRLPWTEPLTVRLEGG